jgi:hypothetical protein
LALPEQGAVLLRIHGLHHGNVTRDVGSANSEKGISPASRSDTAAPTDFGAAGDCGELFSGAFFMPPLKLAEVSFPLIVREHS